MKTLKDEMIKLGYNPKDESADKTKLETPWEELDEYAILPYHQGKKHEAALESIEAEIKESWRYKDYIPGWEDKLEDLIRQQQRLAGENIISIDTSSHESQTCTVKVTVDGEEYNMKTENSCITLKESVETATIGIKYTKDDSLSVDKLKDSLKNLIEPQEDSQEEHYGRSRAENALYDESNIALDKIKEGLSKMFFTSFFDTPDEKWFSLKCKHETLPELDIQTGKYNQRCIKCNEIVK